jgi:hypothetical protein
MLVLNNAVRRLEEGLSVDAVSLSEPITDTRKVKKLKGKGVGSSDTL